MRSNVILQTYYFIVQKHYINSHETAKIYRVYTKVNAVAVKKAMICIARKYVLILFRNIL